MIVQEPVQAAIWHCLNHYAYDDAIFLAERLCTEIETEESLFLLATCYYRSGQIHQALWLLSNKAAKSAECRFLMAKCAYELKQFSEAEHYLSNSDHLRSKNLDEISKDFGDITCFVLQLISKICQRTERTKLANEASQRAIKINPFLFNSFMDLCNRGEKPDPQQVFQITGPETFQHSQGQTVNINSIGCFGSAIDQGSGGLDAANNTTSSNGSFVNINILSTPIDQQQQIPQAVTPNMHGFREGFLVIDDTPLTMAADSGNVVDAATPYRRQFRYLSSLSPNSPSFGVLPILNTPVDHLTIAPPAHQPPTLTDSNDQKACKKIKCQVTSGLINRKEAPLQNTKPVFTQTGNITPRTPSALTGQNVRRSSRIFSNNYSVKENSKSPNINKFTAPRSPPRKAKQRSKVNLSNAIAFEFNEKTEPVVNNTDSKVILNNTINTAQNLAQHLLEMKRQSAEGLMSLLRDIGQAYLHLSQYECDDAIDAFSNVPRQHYKSSWVQSMIALAYHEQRDYEQAVRIFREVHDLEPHRMDLMEIYSTDLWQLQKDVMLSALAQDMMAQNKESPRTWCIAGNCFSAHKEHETAIKFFQRAIQVDPDFAYSYTLLGHELVMTEELDKALSCFRTAILKNPRHYNAWFGIGTIFSKQERYQLAEIHYKRALLINPKNSVILVHIGVMQFFLKKTEQALQTLNLAIDIDPKNPLCKFHRGSMYFSIGKYKDALRELEELKQIVPKESVVYYLIGKIHKKLGNVDSALMHFSWATDLDPKGANNQIKDNFDSIIRTQDTTTGNTNQTTSAVPDGLNIDSEHHSEPSEESGSQTVPRNQETSVVGSNDYDSDSF